MPVQSVTKYNINVWDGILEFMLRRFAPLCEVCNFTEIKDLFARFIKQSQELNNNFNPSQFLVTVESKNTQCPVVMSNQFDLLAFSEPTLKIANTFHLVYKSYLSSSTESLYEDRYFIRDLVRIEYRAPNPEGKVFVNTQFEGRLLDQCCVGYQDRLPPFRVPKAIRTTLVIGGLAAAAYYSYQQGYKKMAAFYTLIGAVALIGPYFLGKSD